MSNPNSSSVSTSSASTYAANERICSARGTREDDSVPVYKYSKVGSRISQTVFMVEYDYVYYANRTGYDTNVHGFNKTNFLFLDGHAETKPTGFNLWDYRAHWDLIYNF